ncbi:MAG: hypothetical protein ACOC3X_01985 [Nanoarchaeota archaeon]
MFKIKPKKIFADKAFILDSLEKNNHYSIKFSKNKINLKHHSLNDTNKILNNNNNNNNNIDKHSTKKITTDNSKLINENKILKKFNDRNLKTTTNNPIKNLTTTSPDLSIKNNLIKIISKKKEEINQKESYLKFRLLELENRKELLNKEYEKIIHKGFSLFDNNNNNNNNISNQSIFPKEAKINNNLNSTDINLIIKKLEEKYEKIEELKLQTKKNQDQFNIKNNSNKEPIKKKYNCDDEHFNKLNEKIKQRIEEKYNEKILNSIKNKI